MIDENSIVIRSQDLISSDIDSEIVMLSIKNGKYYGLNITGSHIWMLLQSSISIKDICNLLVKEFTIDQHQCMQEVMIFINTLIDKNLVEVVDAH